MIDYTPSLNPTNDPNAEFRRLVRKSGRRRREIARLLDRSLPTIHAYMSTRTSKKWRRVDPALVKRLRDILTDQESVAEEARPSSRGRR